MAARAFTFPLSPPLEQAESTAGSQEGFQTLALQGGRLQAVAGRGRARGRGRGRGRAARGQI